MFNNAGISGARTASLLEDDFADFHRVLGTNLLGVFAGTAHAAKAMAASGGGSVVNTASIGGVQPTSNQWAYNASKAAVIHYEVCGDRARRARRPGQLHRPGEHRDRDPRQRDRRGAER